MAGGLTLSTLNDSSGVLATQNGMSGIAKAWVQFNGVTTATINGSFNVSSVTRNSTGNYTVTFTNAMKNANYAATYQSNNGARLTWFDTFTTTSINVYDYTIGSGYADVNLNCVVIFSS